MSACLIFGRAVRLNSSMTAKRSPLNNRVVRSTPGEAEGRTTTLKGSPYTAAGALFQSAFVVFLLPQVLRTLRLLSEDAFSVISTAQVVFGFCKILCWCLDGE